MNRTIQIIIIIITLKGAVPDFFFFFFLQSPHCAANCLQHVRSSGQDAIACKPRATHRVLITCNTSGAYHVQHAVCRTERRDSSAIKLDRADITFMLALFYWLKLMKDGRKTRVLIDPSPSTGRSSENATH